jgi:hypothetical protein
MISLHNAIFALNPSVVTVRGDLAYDADENIVDYDLAAAQAKFIQLQEEVQATLDAQAAAKNSALAKLKKLGLTDDEISALKGTL